MFPLYYTCNLLERLFYCEKVPDLVDYEEGCQVDADQLKGISRKSTRKAFKRLNPGELIESPIFVSNKLPIISCPLSVYKNSGGKFEVGYEVDFWTSRRPYSNDRLLAGFRCLLLEDYGVDVDRYWLSAHFGTDRQEGDDFGPIKLNVWKNLAKEQLPHLRALLTGKVEPEPSLTNCNKYCWAKKRLQCTHYDPDALRERKKVIAYKELFELGRGYTTWLDSK